MTAPTPAVRGWVAAAAHVATLLATLIGCGAPAHEPPPRGAPTVDLLSLLPQARRTTPAIPPEALAQWQRAMGEIDADALAMHAPSRVTFPPLRMTLDARLDLRLDVDQQAWNQAGDGVRFSVYAQPEKGPERLLFSVYRDPKRRPEERGRIDVVVLLGTYAGQDVSLILEADPGPRGDARFDWAIWRRAVLDLGGS